MSTKQSQSTSMARMSLKHAVDGSRISFPSAGKELAIWIFFSLTAMILAVPCCLWLNRTNDDDFFRLVKAFKASKTEWFSSSSVLQPIAALPIISMDLPAKFAPASQGRAQAIAALSPSTSLLGKLADPSSATPLFSGSFSKYDGLINEISKKYKVSPLLVKAIIQTESNYNPLAVSNRGAVGLMQVMPSTAKAMGINDPMDPEKNIVAGVRYLKNLLILFDDDERLAIAAYNCGPAAMKRWGNTPPYPETINYVKKVMSYYNFYLS